MNAAAAAADGCEILAVVAAGSYMAVRQARIWRDRARAYGPPRGIRLRKPWERRARVPGRPYDGILSEQEEAAFEAIAAAAEGTARG